MHYTSLLVDSKYRREVELIGGIGLYRSRSSANHPTSPTSCEPTCLTVNRFPLRVAVNLLKPAIMDEQLQPVGEHMMAAAQVQKCLMPKSIRWTSSTRMTSNVCARSARGAYRSYRKKQEGVSGPWRIPGS